MKNIITLTIALFLAYPIFSQSHWESLVLSSDAWNYLPATSEPPADWYQPGFDDNSWSKGMGGIGYEDGDDITLIDPVNSVYLRRTFTISTISQIGQTVLDVDYDDGFIAYLNGTEIARSRNLTADPVLYNSELTTDHEAQLYQNGMPERHLFDSSLLVEGENTLAVQIINSSFASTDLSGLVFLSAFVQSDTMVYQSTPAWFYPPVEISGESNLPILMVYTNGQTIENEPKILVQLNIINNANGINSIHDTVFEYNGLAGIELRGSTSQMFDKKNYTLETWISADSSLNVPLLGMPEENDWVLHGPYSDKSLMRNVLVYHLGRMTGHWAPRTKFCEFYIDDDYRGVYVLMEKIKQDKNRVNIAKLNPDEISGDDLTGGYIIKIDRPDEGAWTSPYKGRNNINDILISYADPKYAQMPTQQRNYIRNYVTGFENALYDTSFKNPKTGYRAFIDVNSFVDYFLVNELSKNVDAYRLSTFFHKDKDSKGGKLKMGPLWDYNISLGNANYYWCEEPTGWYLDGMSLEDDSQPPVWWDRLREDPYFNTKLKYRWEELRIDKFSNEQIMNFIDSCASLLEEASQRNFARFPILDTWIWPNNYVGGSYANEIGYLKDWTSERLAWLDSQFDLVVPVDTTEISDTSHINLLSPITSIGLEVYPNPFKESVSMRFQLERDASCSIEIRNVTGQLVYLGNFTGLQGSNEIRLNNAAFSFAEGIYIYQLSIDANILVTGKLVKKN